MKTIVVVLALIAVVSCKKDLNVCKDYKQIAGRENKFATADVPVQQMRDTLLKYPQLEIAELNVNNSVTQVLCNVYYENLPVFSDSYSMFKNNFTDTITFSGSILKTTLSVSLNPSIKYEEAIKEARYHVNLDHSCIAYQLGLYNKNRWQMVAPNYRLAWKISDVQNPYIYVIIDATDKSYLYSENGRYYINF